MIIIGAGLTGCLAAMYNQHAQVVVPHSRGELKQHKAIMRFADDSIERITGIKCQKVKVTKSCYVFGDHVEPTINMRNRYSKKVTGGYYDRSISNLDPVTRWVPPANFHERMLSILKGRITFGVDLAIYDFVDEPVISTLPININAMMFGGQDIDVPYAEKRSIYVSKVFVHKCDMWHTTYYPEGGSVYRASLEEGVITIESVHEIVRADIHHVLASFGISLEDHDVLELNYEQTDGKIAPMDDVKRKDAIQRLTLDHNVYSLGRWATWRNIQLVDVIKDLSVIHRLINESEYDLKVGK